MGCLPGVTWEEVGGINVALIYLGRMGGGAKYSIEMAKALQKQCNLVAVVSANARNIAEWRASGLELIEVPTYENRLGFIFSTLNPLNHLRLWQRLRGFAPDVHYYPMFHNWTYLINMLLPRVPSVFTVHDPVLHTGEKSLIMDILQKASIRQAARIILLSKVFIEIMMKDGVPAEKIDVVQHGEFSYEAREYSTADAPGKTILFFGRISAYKGIEVLLDAFTIIKKDVPEARLLIAGSGDIAPYRGKLSGLLDVEVVNRWIEDNEITSFFTGADLVAVPYTDATQSGVIPIAYSLGIPVVATNTGGIPEQVEDGITGILVPPCDVGALAEACTLLLLNEEKRRELGEAGLHKARQEWSWDKVSAQVCQSLAKAAGKPGD